MTPCSATDLLEVSAPTSLIVATKASLRSKKALKTFKLLKTEECDQENWNDFKKIGMFISSSATYFLKAGTPFSLKVTSKALFSGKKTLKI